VTYVIAVEVGSYPLSGSFVALYLASFVAVFREGRGIPVLLERLWPEILLAALLLYLQTSPRVMYLAAHLVILFVLCLLANDALYAAAAAGRLTAYYLVIALGVPSAALPSASAPRSRSAASTNIADGPCPGRGPGVA
jgi:hypothetical protein